VLLSYQNIHYTKVGSGPHLCFLHGFCEDSSIWSYIVDALKSEYTCICIDLPGFGKSRKSTFGSIPEVSSQIKEIISHEEATAVTLFGHSLGGYLVADYLSRFPDVKGAGFIHSTAKADTDSKRLNRQKTRDFVLKNGTDAFFKIFINHLYSAELDPESLSVVEQMVYNTKLSSVIQGLEAMKNRQGREKELIKRAIPTLFLQGEKDRYYPASSIYQQAASCSASRISVIPDVGHLSMLEDKKKCLREIRHFLSFIDSLS